VSPHALGYLPFENVLKPNVGCIGRCYLAYPGVHKARWLLPAEPSLRRVGLNLLGSGGLKRFLGRSLVATGCFRGECIWLDIVPLEIKLARVLREQDLRLAFYLGTPGAYRKLTAQVITTQKHVPAYAKIAEDALARASLEREYETLTRLSSIDALSERVPRALGWFNWANARVLLVTPGPGQAGPRRLMTSHAEFLHTLHQAFVEARQFETSAMWYRMVDTVQCLDSQMSGEWSRRFQRAFDKLRDTLGTVTLPLSLAHRDFAPWNTRLASNGLFVFDWEVAADGMTPLYDVLHFHAIQAALSGRPYRAKLAYIRRIGGADWPGTEDYFEALSLAYLTDMSLHYTEARLRLPEAGEEAVQSWFGREIDSHLVRNHELA
jgi:hypothetical protein